MEDGEQPPLWNAGLQQEEELRLWHEYFNDTLPAHVHQLVQEALLKKDDDMVYNDTLTREQVSVWLSGDQQRYLSLVESDSGGAFVTWSFVKGLILGQLSITLLLLFFIKVFLFGDRHSTSTSSTPHIILEKESDENGNNSKNNSNNNILSKRFLTSLMKSETVSLQQNNVDSERHKLLLNILDRTAYDVETHDPESLDWFNVLIAQALQQFRKEAWQKNNILHSINNFIEQKSNELPKFLDTIKITELNIGNGFPLFSNCRINFSPNTNKQKLEAKIDIEMSDRISLGVETQLLLNYPVAAMAALPISVIVSIIEFKACLTVSLTTSEEFGTTVTTPTPKDLNEENKGYFLVFSFSPDYIMKFETQSLVGARSKLENIPKVANLIESYIKNWFVERCVEPRFQFVELPSVWPRSKNTRQEPSSVILTQEDSVDLSI